MVTNMTTPIALRISGTKERRAGFAPLATVGVLPGGEGDNMDRITKVSEKPAYVIKHAPGYVLYLLIDRRVKSFDADAPGVLSIALAIASNVQLAGGTSPYTLLREVYDKFVADYMIPVSDGRDSFKNTDVDSEVFRQIVSKYATEPRHTAYVTMSPTGMSGTICVPADKIAAFFCDTQYKEMAQFKDVEVGISCPSSPGLESLSIPRPMVYEVYINNERTGRTLSNANDVFVAEKAPTRTVEYPTVSFCLQEVFSAPNFILQKDGATIQIDPTNNIIHCQLPKRNIVYRIDIVWNCSEEDKQAIMSLMRSGHVKLTHGQGQDITAVALGESGTLPAAATVGNVAITPTASDYTLSATRQTDDRERILRITISARKKVVSPVTSTRQQAGQRSGQQMGGRTGNQPRPVIGDKPMRRAGKPIGKPEYLEPEDDPVNDGGNSKKPFFIGLLVGLLLGAGLTFGLMTLLGGDKNEENKPETEQQEGQQAAQAGEQNNDSINAVAGQAATGEPEFHETENEELVTDDVHNSKEVVVADNKDKSKVKTPEEANQSLDNTLDKKAKEKVEEASAKEILAAINSHNLTNCRTAWNKDKNKKIINQTSRVHAENVIMNYTGVKKNKLTEAGLLPLPTFKSLDEVEQYYHKMQSCLNNQ